MFGVEQISGDSRQNLHSVDTYVNKSRSGKIQQKRSSRKVIIKKEGLVCKLSEPDTLELKFSNTL